MNWFNISVALLSGYESIADCQYKIIFIDYLSLCNQPNPFHFLFVLCSSSYLPPLLPYSFFTLPLLTLCYLTTDSCPKIIFVTFVTFLNWKNRIFAGVFESLQSCLWSFGFYCRVLFLSLGMFLQMIWTKRTR